METRCSIGGEYVCLLSHKDATFMKVNFAGKNTNIGPIYRLENPIKNRTTIAEDFGYFIHPFLIHCHLPEGDIYDMDDGEDGEVYLHVTYAPEMTTGYTTFKISILLRIHL